MEEWRAVPGYEGRYEVSDQGRVKGPRKILSPVRMRHGYDMVQLYKDGGAKGYLVHVLVALAFIGPKPKKKTHTHHKNGIRHDNRLSNLEYLSAWENVRKGKYNEDGTHKRLNINYSLDEDSVRLIRREFDTHGASCMTALAHRLGVSFGLIQGVAYRNRYLWVSED